MRTDDPHGAVRLPLWSGMQPVAALWFDAPRLPAETRARRMLACWRTGAQALRFADGDLLRFAQPWLGDCASLPGLALRSVGDGASGRGVLTSAPLGADELAAHRGFDLILVRGAQASGLRMSDGAALDLSAWVEIGDYALHDTFDCSVAQKALSMPPLQGRDVREVLGSRIPPPSAERDDFLERMIAANAGRNDGGRGGLPQAHGRSVGGALLGRLAGWFGVAAQSLAGNAASGGGQYGLAQRHTPQRPSAWREALARAAIASRVSRLIGWRQGAYLRRMMKLFDEGDLGEALRHALPIDGTGQSLGQGFGTPGRRGDLRLGAGGNSVDMHLGEALQQHLRAMYRQTFERLDRQGRIDEAVFVLGELLNARQECLDYLERHGRHMQAAELALAWDMPTATLVRLLVLGGDWTRAVQVARRDGEFGAAVKALEKTHPDMAVKLRLLWGEALADRGDWLAAADAVWPVPQARNLAIEWLRIAEDAGATLSARALVRRAERLPDTLDRYGERILALAEPGDAEQAEVAAAARSALADALLDGPKRNPTVAAIANALLPAIAADRAAGRNALSKSRLNKLLSLGGDPYLKADLPVWSLPPVAKRPGLWARKTPAEIAAPAAGLAAIHDVVPLGDRRYLIALGEAGVIVVDARGKTLQRYPVPADSLVLADNGNIALAVARRESLSRVSRLDLVRHTATDLGSLRLDAHAPYFDGAAWSVIADNRILVIDTAKSLRDVVWHVGDLPGRLVGVRYTPPLEFYLLDTANGLEMWNYTLPTRRLVQRTPVKAEPGLPVLLVPFGGVLQPRIESCADGLLQIRLETYGGRRSVDMTFQRQDGSAVEATALENLALRCHAVQNGVVLGVVGEDIAQYRLCRLSDGETAATIEWATGVLPQFREFGQHLLFFDREGRVLDLGTEHDTRTAFSVC